MFENLRVEFVYYSVSFQIQIVNRLSIYESVYLKAPMTRSNDSGKSFAVTVYSS